MSIGICGNGRVGSKVAEQLSKMNKPITSFRLEPKLGLIKLEGAIPKTLDLLIICISSSRSQTDWSWENIFAGLRTQLESKKITLKHIIFVSSTRVYDGTSKGIIDASCKATPFSKKAISLFKAEQALLSLNTKVDIVRCAGLIGAGYEKYQAMLKDAKDKPRFAIDIASVVKTIVALSINESAQSSLSILTDGYVHYQGNAYNYIREQAVILKLAEQHKILVNSTINIQQAAIDGVDCL